MSGNDSVASSLAAFFACLAVIVLMGVCLYGLILLSRRWKRVMKERVLAALKMRRKTSDTFRNDNGYSWDYLIAFRVYDEEDCVSDLQMKYNMQYVLNQLLAGGLEFRLFYSLNHKEVYCKIRCSVRRMQKHADLVDFKLLLDQEQLRTLCTNGREGKWDSLRIPVDSDLSKLDPYEFIYAKYEFDPDTNQTSADMASLYKRWPRIELNQETESSLTFDVASHAKNPLTYASKFDVVESDLAPKAESFLFRGVDRLKLIHLIISYGGPGGCGLDTAQMLKDDCILAYSPLHDSVELRFLESEWLKFFAWPWKQPSNMIKDYFGEKIGLYFEWLGHYTTWLMSASLVGFVVWCTVASEGNNPSAMLIPYFAGFMGLWSAMYLENWKRKEKTLAMEWGTVGFEEEEQSRPQFKGEVILSPVTGKPVLFFSRQERAKRSFKSQWIIIGLILVVIIVIAAIFALRVVIAKFDVNVASVSASLLIAIQIQVLNGYFGELAIKLNNYENHRTDTEYEDALIAKTFAFQFVNSFASLFYIAFIKPFIQLYDPCVDGCMAELQSTLGTIFITRIVVGNITELGIPILQAMMTTRERSKAAGETSIASSPRESNFNVSQDGVAMMSSSNTPCTTESLRTELSEVERTFLMPSYDVMLGPFEDYAELVIQFGYTTMFVSGFPLAPLMSFVNNYVEIRVDAWKLCQLCRRPEPRSGEDIGTWYYILEIISVVSIFINSGIVAFTAENTINYTWPLRVWIFILMSAGLFSIRMAVAWLIPDEPAEVVIQLQRQEYIVNKVMFDVEDEDDAALSKGLYTTPSYLVKLTDDDPM